MKKSRKDPASQPPAPRATESDPAISSGPSGSAPPVAADGANRTDSPPAPPAPPAAPAAAAAASPPPVPAAGKSAAPKATSAAGVLGDIVEQAMQLLPDFLREAADAKSTAQLEDLRIRYMGKKGRVTDLMKQLGRVAESDRPKVGKTINEEKAKLLAEFERRLETLKRAEGLEKLQAEKIDITLPGIAPRGGHLHPITAITRRIEAIFVSMGFEVIETGEIEDEWFNFEALNIQADHPARDMQDTFYVEGGRVLRTHTSPTQIHAMLDREPPVAVIGPGKVYRCDDDITHSPMFHQIEGFLVDRDVTFGHLKGVLNEFVHALFGPKARTRFRPSFFPFTEPSAEVDVGCIFCDGKGCRVCSNTGWLEVLGSGMIHPAVLENVGYDPEAWSGFAFGLGVERIAMLSYGIGDIRLFYDGDQRFLRQF